MMMIDDLNGQYGYTPPPNNALYAVIRLIETKIKQVLPLKNGIKGIVTKHARLKLAEEALGSGYGYSFRVHSFKDLSWGEIEYIRLWINQVNIEQELKGLDIIPLSLNTIQDLLCNDLGTRERRALEKLEKDAINNSKQ